MHNTPTPINQYPKYWAECYGVAPFLPTSRKEMDALGWDSCDIIIVTGDAYVDHPSFGMAIIGRLLESQGFRVGILAQPEWKDKSAFMELGKPNLFFGVTAGNMDSMINRYTADKKLRHDDAYTPNNEGGKRPDRATLVYSQRCREAYKDAPIVLGGIEASLRRIAHYDYWSDKVRRSVLFDAKADILLFGNAERALVEVAHRIANGEDITTLTNIRGTAVNLPTAPEHFKVIDSSRIEKPGKAFVPTNPYQVETQCETKPKEEEKAKVVAVQPSRHDAKTTAVRIPPFEKLKNDRILYAHASRIMHLETNPYSGRALIQKHGDRELWVNQAPIPLTTEEMDFVFGLPYARVPHPMYGKAKIPAYDMIKTSVNIMRGCFGGCSFCSITEHEGRIIQNRSKESIINELEEIRDKVPGFTGTISDLGGPTANMYRLGCSDPKAEINCRRPSCVFPGICHKLDTDHKHTIDLYREARQVKGIKKVMIASGVRYDLAIESPEYVKELVTHHVGGYLKIAPEHTEKGPLDKMMKPGMGTYDRFKEMFEKYSKEAGKKQYLIPYFIAAHPGTEEEDMVNLALWLKANNFECDQVQNFYPSPMCNATSMYYSETNPLKRVKYKQREDVPVAKGEKQRRLHKALLRYHDPANWPMIREALISMGKKHLIGDKPGCLIPAEDVDSKTPAQRRRSGRHGANRFATKHTKNQPDIRKDQARKEQARKGKAQKEDSRGQGKPNNKPKHKQRSRA
ncbi:putative B12 binding domain (B12-BD)fused with Radical SAM superfamily protein [Vibrio nigripulchritudo SFn27]|uniref:Putative B12 binding domain (B12-BD)fused with Radical SAM superfamily protein n=1 Tax=Vibrio nigripulchritudo TaxID=28173 RepID=U4KG21_9VIBR|nr:YgiQ family radical SAM protein [Vibrio nigripulchritudo]CCN82723.1 putative B12 binding domain (B12-BD)fused with Radical SAM superfamily protein [Vibrio nigripulchritudo BLFn1]CCN89873.1 putative B12 binding domain (B12-BD)fused with Radical SAM superfamily protein [Vibrio nigripulchritudo SFn27]CCN92270.1 putative B12 binding domain (B12-BD)fused with Radical SAM superfamily protein [Vibrio nigripulchritudo ENn2]CCO43757.1 putative B12 binding domain (B12-BD)fused with Radical SAM superfa